MPMPAETLVGMTTTQVGPADKAPRRKKTKSRAPDEEKEEQTDFGSSGVVEGPMTLESQSKIWKKKKEGRNSTKYSVMGSQNIADDGELPTQTDLSDDIVVSEIARQVQQIQEWTTKQDKAANDILKKQVRLEKMIETLAQNLAGPMSPNATKLQALGATMIMPQSVAVADGQPDARLLEGFSDVGDEEIEVASETQSTDALADHRMHHSRQEYRESEKSIGRLHSVFVQAIWNLPNEKAGIDHRPWHWQTFESIVEHWAFEWVSAAVILAHSIFIGAHVEYLASTDHNGHMAFSTGNVLFVVCFSIEVLVKLGAEREEFFQGAEYRWNIVDIVLLGMVLIEMPLGIMIAGKDKAQRKTMKTALKIAEMIRTARILRIFRFLKFSRTLRVILSKILASVRAISWLLVLVCLQLYVCAVCLTQGSNDYFAGNQQDPTYVMNEDEAQVLKRVGNIPKSFYTLFASISGGLLWGEVAEIILHIGWFYVAIHVAFICFSIFAVLNVMTGIIVDDTFRADADLVMEHEANLRKEQAVHLRKMFSQMDLEEDGAITLKEFKKFAHDDALKVYLDALGIKPDEAGTLFQLLDEDGSGEILIDEFINGCLHLRGEATSLDMKTLLFENRRMRHKVFAFIHYTEDEYQKLFVAVGQMQKELKLMHEFYDRFMRPAKIR